MCGMINLHTVYLLTVKFNQIQNQLNKSIKVFDEMNFIRARAFECNIMNKSHITHGMKDLMYICILPMHGGRCDIKWHKRHFLRVSFSVSLSLSLSHFPQPTVKFRCVWRIERPSVMSGPQYIQQFHGIQIISIWLLIVTYYKTIQMKWEENVGLLK